MTVVDSSFVGAAVFDETDSAFVIASDIWRRPVGAPALLSFEFANQLWKKTRRGELDEPGLRRATERFDAIGAALEPPPTFEAIGRIAALAVGYDLTAYDASYLEMALRIQAGIATLDSRLARAGRTAGLAVTCPR